MPTAMPDTALGIIAAILLTLVAHVLVVGCR